MLGLRRAAGRCLLVRTRAITGDQFDFWMAFQPLGQGRRISVWQQVDDLVPLQVDEDGAVALPFAPGPVIDAQLSNRGRGRYHPPQLGQQGIGTDRTSQDRQDPCGTFGTHFQRHLMALCVQSGGRAPPGARDGGQAFTEDALGAVCLVAEILSDRQSQPDALAEQRNVLQDPGILAVRPRRELPTPGTWGRT